MAANPPVMLVILDGWGWREESADNAVRLADTPVFDRLWATCPHAFLRTSGLDVGLPVGQMGNSEVGHMNIGAGRVVMQDLPRIGQAIADGSLDTMPELLRFIAAMKASGGTCHVIGLISQGGVHSHQDHPVALARVLAAAGLRVLIHVILDGRDTAPRSADAAVARLRAATPGVPIASVSGRYYAMDRDKRWDRVAKAYLAMAEAQGPVFADAASVIDDAYGREITDEFVLPAVVAGYRGMKDGDGLLCFNFRADRVREILGALVDPAFDGFPRARTIKFAACLGMTRYSDDLAPYMAAVFPPQTMKNLLGDVVEAAGRTQLRMAETEKYPHVTYFLNGGDETQRRGEERQMVASPKVATYDLQPEMSAPELCDKAVAAIQSGAHDLIVLNFANADMVGHTGQLAATIEAVETVDKALGRIVAAIEAKGGALLVTADHGNAELMRDPATGGPHTAHTTNPVPVLLVGGHATALHDGRLADVAPTLLGLMGIPLPPEMTGRSLVG